MSRASESAAAQGVLDQALTAARGGDRAAFQAQLSPRDPAFADSARQFFDNLSTLPLTQLQVRLLPDRRVLSAERQRVLGPDAWRQAATITWRLPGDTAAADQRVWFTFVLNGSGTQLAGLLDGPAGEPATRQPSWWLGPVRNGRQGQITVVVGAGQSPARWLRLGQEALSHARKFLPDTVGTAAQPTLVLEVPATTADFERVVGVDVGSYADIGAVTLAEGSTPQAALRIAVNPDAVRRLTADGLGVSLTHEAVHVLTRSPGSPAPIWAVEGLADWIALQAYPKADEAVAGPLLSDVAAAGPPAALPADAAFDPDAGRLDLAYAQSWFAWRYLATTSSPSRLGRLYRELDRGRTLDQAASEVLGSSAAQLTAGWRRYLRAQAQGH